MKLKLNNPLVFFDLETTGVDPIHDRIVEISCLKVFPDGREEQKTKRINPERHIPEQSTAVHGITDEDVKDAPTFKQIAKSLAKYLEGCDLAGFNSNRFDIPMLAEEFLHAGLTDVDLSRHKFIDVQVIYHKLEPRTLSKAYQYYCGRELESAHSADADTRGTYEVLMAQLDKYPDVLKNDIGFLSDYSSHNKQVDYASRMIYNEKNEPIFNFGKYKGQPVKEVLKEHPEYYDWMQKGDFAANTKQMLTKFYMEIHKK